MPIPFQRQSPAGLRLLDTEILPRKFHFSHESIRVSDNRTSRVCSMGTDAGIKPSRTHG